MSDAVELAEVPQLFEGWLAGRPLADRSRREYARNVRSYCAWLATTPDRAGWQGDPLTDPLARDHAARDFRRWLQVERRAAASTVNLALARSTRCTGASGWGARMCAATSRRSRRRDRWTRPPSGGCCGPPTTLPPAHAHWSC